MNDLKTVVSTFLLGIQELAEIINEMDSEECDFLIDHLDLGVVRKMSEEFTSRNMKVTSNRVKMDD